MKLMAAAIAAGTAILTTTVASAKDQIILGWVENGILSDQKIRLAAKLDTGARTTSLHTEDAEIFKRGGKRWVRFTVVSKGKSYKFERPVYRMAKIKRTGVRVQPRPVVLMRLCLGSYVKMAQVNLTNRSNMRFELLIGRKFMGDRILVNSNKTYTTEPRCAS